MQLVVTGGKVLLIFTIFAIKLLCIMRIIYMQLSCATIKCDVGGQENITCALLHVYGILFKLGFQYYGWCTNMSA